MCSNVEWLRLPKIYLKCNMINYTIIIPHYNSYELLKKCVTSIPFRKDIQIIIIDDNSLQPPPTTFFWQGFGPHVDKILLKENRTAGGARNEGIKIAKGKWVIFADADDYFEPNAFSSFDRFLNSEYDIIYFRTISRFSDTSERSDRHIYYNELLNEFSENNRRTYNRLRFHFGPPWGKMISRRLIIDNCIWFDEVRYSNDVMFSTKIGYYAKKVFADTDIVYCITVSHGSLVNTQTVQSLKQRYVIALKQNLYLRERGLGDYEKPIMNYVRRSAKYGLKHLFEFITIGRQNKAKFFIGSGKWFSNMIEELMHKDDKKKYVVK